MSTQRKPAAWLVALILVVASVGIGGAASAFWRVSGTGDGSSATGTTVPITLSEATSAAGLYPGGSSEVRAMATNTNSADVRLRSVVLDSTQGTGGFAVSGDTPTGGCLPSSFSFTGSSTGWNIPADGTLQVTLPNAITMVPTAANACQGATVTVFLRAGS